MNYFMSFLALKLLGNERYAHVGDRAFDPGLGLFAGLNTIPKCTALSTYAYSLDAIHLTKLQKAFVKQAHLIHVINLAVQDQGVVKWTIGILYYSD